MDFSNIVTKSVTGNKIEINLDKMEAKTIDTLFKIKTITILHHEGNRAWAFPVQWDGKDAMVAFYDNELGGRIHCEIEKRKAAALDKKIPGLTVLRAAEQGEAAYFEAVEKMMQDEMNDGVSPPQQPEMDRDALSKQYPIAAAYLKAEGYEDAANDKKSSAGREAKKLLLEGGSLEQANHIMNNWTSGIYFD